MIKQVDTTSILNLIAEGSSVIDKKPEEAMTSFTLALQQSKDLGFAKGMALAYGQTGKWYFSNNMDKSIYYSKQALDIFAKYDIGTVENEAEVHLLLAEAYDEQGRQDSSAYYYYLLEREIEIGNITNPRLAIDVYTKLTIFWINLDYGSNENDEYFKTIKRYVDKAKLVATKLKDSADAVSSVYFLQGAYFHGLKKFDSARAYYFLYLEERERLKKLKPPRRISTLVNIADTYLQQERPAEAILYIDKIGEQGKILKQSNYLAFYLLFADLMKSKALYQEKQYSTAIVLLNTTLEKMKSTGGHLRNEVVEAYKILAECYEATGEYKKALADKNKYGILYDSLMKKDKAEMINRLEIRYRIAAKDKELAEQKLTIAEVGNSVRSRNYFIGGISFLAIFSALAFALWRRKNMHKQKLQQEKIDNLQQKMEIERLNATIDGEEKERTRIARELHDGIGGLLTAAK